jgi:hypothetical protein
MVDGVIGIQFHQAVNISGVESVNPDCDELGWRHDCMRISTRRHKGICPKLFQQKEL